MSSNFIENLVPGAQYQVVIYLRKGPLVGPPSDPVMFAIGNLLTPTPALVLVVCETNIFYF